MRKPAPNDQPPIQPIPKPRKSQPKTNGPRPLWQPPQINGRNGNVINGYFYAIIEGKRVSLRTADERTAWDTLAARRAAAVSTPDKNPTIGALIERHLANFRETCEKNGKLVSYEKKLETLWDFATGHTVSIVDGKTKNGKRVHAGYGKMLVKDFVPHHVEQWIAAHPKWGDSTTFTRVCLVQALFNDAVRMKLIDRSPLAGWRTDAKIANRMTYFDAEIEKQIYAAASKEFAEFLFLLIETGMRPFSEAAKLTADHIQINDQQQMKFSFGKRHKTGAKTGKNRYVYPTAAVAKRVLELMVLHPRGSGRPLFQTVNGLAWKDKNAQAQFIKLRNAIKLDEQLKAKFGEEFGEPCLYSCRHTFATRMIPKVGLAKTATMMGNTIRIAERTYGHLDCLHEALYEAAGQ